VDIAAASVAIRSTAAFLVFFIGLTPKVVFSVNSEQSPRLHKQKAPRLYPSIQTKTPMDSNRYELIFMDSFLPNFPIIKGWN